MPSIMTTAFYLLPGARLPQGCAREVLASLTDADRTRLTALGTGREPPGIQRLSEPLHEYSPHRAWLWKVLTHRTGAPVIAPYAWMAEHGPRLDQEFWSIDFWTKDPSGRLARFEFADDALPRAACAADPVLAESGMRLMISGKSFYAATREGLDYSARPFEDLCGMEAAHIAHLPHLADGADKERVNALLHRIEGALREALPEETKAICGLWLSGGGRSAPVFPPSTFRSVLANDRTALAWAEDAGIPKAYLGTLGKKTKWPEAPEGDRILVIDDLYDAWLKHDWDAWVERIPKLLDKLEHWIGEEKPARLTENVIVAFGHGTSATLVPEKRGALGFLKRKNVVSPEDWLLDSEPKSFETNGEEAA